MLLKTTVFISIGGLLVWFLLTQATSEPRRQENLTPQRQGIADRYQRRHRTPDPLTDFQNTDFYRTIIDNNLFHPLGWQPPRPREPYRLIGTILPRDENTPPRAIFQTIAGNKTYIVTIGENLDTHTEVVDIQSKQVTLATDGKQRTLKLPIRF